MSENDDILENLQKVLPKEDFDFLKERFATQLNLFPETTKLISCPKEIVFSITANVLEENEQGQNMGSVEILTRTYHMPVPPDKDYEEFMRSFVEFFEKLMLDSHKHANENTKEIQKDE